MIILPPRASKPRAAAERLTLPWLRRIRIFRELNAERIRSNFRLRSPWLAGALSLVPGLGHCFVEGRLWKLAAFNGFVLFALGWVYAFGSSWLGQWPALVLFPFLCWVVADASLRARSLSGEPPAGILLRLRISLASGVWLVVAWWVLLGAAGVQSMWVPGSRFHPLLKAGHHYLMTQPPQYRPGDLVFIGRYENYDDAALIAATEGQSMQLDQGSLSVDGRLLDQGASQPLLGRLTGPDFVDGRLTLGPSQVAVIRPFGSGPWPVQVRDFARLEVHRVIFDFYPRWEFVR